MVFSRKFKQKYDRRAVWISIIAFLVGMAVIMYIAFTSGGSYLPGWIGMVLVAMLALMSLSVPRYLLVTRDAIEIHCLVKFEQIHFNAIKSIKAVNKKHARWLWPIPMIGSFAVLGYYGYYIDLYNRKVVKLYAKAYNNLVIVEDIYEDIYILGVPDADKFIDVFEKRKL